ncbi:MAG: hypothetical protein ACRDRW_01725 [Pseudonocardiaceae bacterium]
MVLVLVRDAVRSYSENGSGNLEGGDSLTGSVHDGLREYGAPAGALLTLAKEPRFADLLGDDVGRESAHEHGVHLVVDGVRVGLGYDPQCEAPAETDRRWQTCEIVLRTNYERYSVYTRQTAGEPGLALSWTEDAASLEQLLRYHGGLVRLARCADWAIVSRSIAIDLLAGNVLTAGHSARAGESSLAAKLHAFVQNGARLKSILDVHKELFPHSAEQAAMRPESTMGTQRRILHPALSAALNYRGSVSAAQRSDYISTYVSSDGREWCREFLVEQESGGQHARDLRLLEYNLLYLLGIRRTKLFRADYSARLYSVMLPSAVLSRAGSPVLAVVPLLSLSRLPNSSRFRSTIGLTFIVVPVQSDDNGALVARRTGVAETTEIAVDLSESGTVQQSGGVYTIDGPLVDYLGGGGTSTSIPDLVARLADNLVRWTCNGNAARYARASAAAVRGLVESSMGSVCYLVDWPGGRHAPWARWSAGDEDKMFERVLHRSVFYADHVNPAQAFSTSDTVDFRSLGVGNAHGADMSGLTFYNPHLDSKFVLYPQGSEQYPNHSMLRWFAWQIYLDVAFSCVRALLGRFHDNIDTITDLRHVLRAVQDLSTELSEVYDLDLADFFYRREYEKLRSILRLDSDYEYMRTRLASAQGESSLREQMLMNSLVLALAMSSLLTTLVVTVGQHYKWTVEVYLYGAAAAIATALVISFSFFGPLRRITARIRLLIAGRRR